MHPCHLGLWVFDTLGRRRPSVAVVSDGKELSWSECPAIDRDVICRDKSPRVCIRDSGQWSGRRCIGTESGAAIPIRTRFPFTLRTVISISAPTTIRSPFLRLSTSILVPPDKDCEQSVGNHNDDSRCVSFEENRDYVGNPCRTRKYYARTYPDTERETTPFSVCVSTTDSVRAVDQIFRCYDQDFEKSAVRTSTEKCHDERSRHQ